MSIADPKFVAASVDFDKPRRMSPSKLLDHLKTSGNWPEASIHHATHQYPIMDIEFHGRAGFSLLCFDKASSVGYLAAGSSRLSKPSVLVCLGGQVIEKWPPELFLPLSLAKTVISHFFKTGEREPSVKWVRLDRFRRETVHPGGRGLIPLWQRLRRQPQFPFAQSAANESS
jgi:hypothetical protein